MTVIASVLLLRQSILIINAATPPEIAILLSDSAHLPAHVILKSQDEATRIFASAGIQLVWIDVVALRGALPQLSVIIEFEANTKATPPIGEILGGVPRGSKPSGQIAFVFYGPIERRARQYRLDLGRIFGAVMAHEIGHLLLPTNVHSSGGIMGGPWDQRQLNLAGARRLTFTMEQAEMIRKGR